MKRIFLAKEEGSESRTALVPIDCTKLIALGYTIVVQRGAGLSYYSDAEYSATGVTFAATFEEGCAQSDIIVRVNKSDSIEKIAPKTLHISSFDAFNDKETIKKYAKQGIKLVSLEMLPRSTIAQKMDILSSQASLAGYYAVLLAATRLPKIFAMMMTAAGTLASAKVVVIGAGVAGLQVIATAKRLGASIEAFDTRPEAQEQVKSLGAKFITIELGETEQTAQGYASTLSEEQIEGQRRALTKVCSSADVVITTAKVFGHKAPLLLTNTMLQQMKPGSVVIDMAVKTGGNVEGWLNKNDEERMLANGVLLINGDGLERYVAKDASLMFSGNMMAFLSHFWDNELQGFNIEKDSEMMQSCLITNNGAIIHHQFKN
jgi:NAD(P) transhydrogenase subunit alpha